MHLSLFFSYLTQIKYMSNVKTNSIFLLDFSIQNQGF